MVCDGVLYCEMVAVQKKKEYFVICNKALHIPSLNVIQFNVCKLSLSVTYHSKFCVVHV